MDSATLNSSRVEGNSAPSGGGVYGLGGGYDPKSVINSCLILNNTATGSGWDDGGGGLRAWGCMLNNSTVISNSAPIGGGVSSEGFSEFNNCILWGNHSGSGDRFAPNWADPVLNTCSEDGVTHGSDGCITSDPLFVNSALHNFRLQDGSPCINRGTDAHVPYATDAAGNTRIVATVDMGAYERQLVESSTAGPAEGARDVHIIYVDLSNNVSQVTVTASNRSSTAQIISQGAGWIELSLPSSPDPYGPLTVNYTFATTNGGSVVLSNAYTYAIGLSLPYYAAASQLDDSGNGQSWLTAKKSIQAAIDLTRSSDYVLVTNGVYDTGATVTPRGALSNRICMTSGADVRSMNGPDETVIRGTNGMRCVYLSSGILSGFTLIGGNTFVNTGIHQIDRNGGALWITTGVASNCILSGSSAQFAGGAWVGFEGLIIDSVITNNSADSAGAAWLAAGGQINRCRILDNFDDAFCGGVYVDAEAELNNCLVKGNRTDGDAGGVRVFDGGRVNNCTVVGNMADNAAGVYLSIGAWVGNSIVWSNRATSADPDIRNDGGEVYNTCASAGVTHGVAGCITSDPQWTEDYQLQSDSPCINAGSNTYVNSTLDLEFGVRQVGPIDMGALEVQQLLSVHTGPAVGGGSLRIYAAGLGGTVTNVTICGVPASVTTQGVTWIDVTLPTGPDPYVISLGDVLVAFGYNQTILFTNSYAFARGINLPFYADASRTEDSGNGQSWAAAKKTIQAAVDAAQPGDYVLVTNGTYTVGGALTPGYGLSNRLVISKRVQVRSVNGPDGTIIKGSPGSNGGNDTNSVRCVYMTSDASLSGFTLMNGYASSSGNISHDQSGGGLWLTAGCSASNCIITGCAVEWGFGAGVCFDGGGTVTHSTLSGNTNAWSTGGGAYFEKGGSLSHSFVTGNSADSGGGLYFANGGGAENCLLTENAAGWSGGGGAFFAGGGTLNNCTLVGNTGEWGDGAGAYLAGGGTLLNSIVWSNITGGAVADVYNGAGSVYNTCAAVGVTCGTNGCITNHPLFDNAYRLQQVSPCINVGTNSFLSATDLDDATRVYDVTVDMGAYEAVETTADTDSDDLTDWREAHYYGSDWNRPDTDGDNMRDGDELIAGTDMLSRSSVLELICSAGIGGQMEFSWFSVSNRQYTLQGRTNLIRGVWMDLPDCSVSAPSNSVRHSATNRNFFYRLNVREE